MSEDTNVRSIEDRFKGFTQFRINAGVSPYGGRKFPGVWLGREKEAVILYVNSVAGNSPMQGDGRTYFANEVTELGLPDAELTDAESPMTDPGGADTRKAMQTGVHLMDIGENLYDYLNNKPRKRAAAKRKVRKLLEELRTATEAVEGYEDQL